MARAVAATGQFPVKAVADTLGVARSNLVEQLQRPERPPRGPCRNPQLPGGVLTLAEVMPREAPLAMASASPTTA